MALLTTTIGSYPKPDYVPTPDWFRAQSTSLTDPTRSYDEYLLTHPEQVEELLVKGTQEVLLDQVNAGINVPTDGEIRRENYIHYHCRHLDGIDFSRLTNKTMRAGSWVAEVPTIVSPVKARGRFLPQEWQIAQSITDQPVKMTLPGPMTITDSLVDAYYGDEKRLGAELAVALNEEIKALAEAGCTWIQVDEPVFAREPEKAIAFGIDNLDRSFFGVPEYVKRAVHICCGYPDQVDNEAYPKADPSAYFQLSDGIEASSVHAVSIEDAHRHNNLSLLERFTSTKVIFGVIAIARTRVEQVEEITIRLEEALQHIDSTRLIVAPDCGLGMLDRDTVLAKMKNMVAAAHYVS
jgi:5-methyltetrahydropteroyltriglutamate--homocysteine methyltransferase